MNNRFYYREKKAKQKTTKKALVKGVLMWTKIFSVSGDLSQQGIVLGSERFSVVFLKRRGKVLLTEEIFTM